MTEGATYDEGEREIRRMVDALHCARAALTAAPQTCRYHGSNFEFLGFERGAPCCESCRQPHRVVTALGVVNRELDRYYQREGATS